MMARNLLGTAGATAALMVCLGCSGSNSDSPLKADSPTEAASYLDNAFQNADQTTRKNVGIASEALRNGEYEKAVVSLQTVKSGQNVTFEQGMAIHSSVINLERELVRGVERGDPNAQRAYQLLKQMNRN